MSQFLRSYRALDTNLKTLLTVVNKECGFAIAAELCNHLVAHSIGEDDDFWKLANESDKRQIVELARAHGLKAVGYFEIKLGEHV